MEIDGKIDVTVACDPNGMGKPATRSSVASRSRSRNVTATRASGQQLSVFGSVRGYPGVVFVLGLTRCCYFDSATPCAICTCNEGCQFFSFSDLMSCSRRLRVVAHRATRVLVGRTVLVAVGQPAGIASNLESGSCHLDFGRGSNRSVPASRLGSVPVPLGKIPVTEEQ